MFKIRHGCRRGLLLIGSMTVDMEFIGLLQLTMRPCGGLQDHKKDGILMVKTRFVLGFLVSLRLSSATAQVNSDYQRILTNGWNYPLKNGFRMLAVE